MDSQPASQELDADKMKYLVFYELKMKQLNSEVYPVCIENCVLQNNSSPKLVLTRSQLVCAQNCLQKYKASLNLALGLLTLKEE